MFDLDLRLISVLSLLTAVVIASLVLDYLNLLRRPVRLSMGVAILGIIAGVVLTLNAVMPNDHFYGPVLSQVPTNEKVVALTFDDGPYPPYTGEILDILQQCHVTATFFVIGQNAEKYPDLVRRIAADGHEIGNHSYSHIDFLKVNRKAIADQIDRTNRIITAITGQTPTLVRTPHGFRDAAVMDIVQQRHMKVVEWSVASRDWTNPGVDIIVQRTVSKVKDGSIILLHDGDGVEQRASREQTVEATRIIIRQLQAQGYKFVTIDELYNTPEE